MFCRKIGQTIADEPAEERRWETIREIASLNVLAGLIVPGSQPGECGIEDMCAVERRPTLDRSMVRIGSRLVLW